MDREFLRDLFAGFGAVEVKRMFGSLSLSTDGLTFAMVIGDQIYLKADAESVSAFEAEKCEPFRYETKDRRVSVMSYWQIPQRLYDDPYELAQWARSALEAARRASASKRKRAK